MGNRPSAPTNTTIKPAYDPSSSKKDDSEVRLDVSKPPTKPTKSKTKWGNNKSRVKKKDFQVLLNHQPPGYSEAPSARRCEAHSDFIARQLDEIEASRANAIAIARMKADGLPSYGEVERSADGPKKS